METQYTLPPHVPAEELHTLGVDHLTAGKAGVEVHLSLLATVQDDTLTLPDHLYVHAYGQV